MTIPALFFFTLLMAVGGLAIDIQRVYGVHGQMQAYVDEVALAAATELDGLTGAINRSLLAAVGNGSGINPLISGKQNFATNTSLNVIRVTFLSRLDQDPGPLGVTPTPTEVSMGWVLCTYTDNTDDGIANGTWTGTLPNCNTNATNVRTANFVEVRAVPRTVNYLVLPIADAIGQFVGAGSIVSSATVALRATAGYQVEVCNNIPMMFCNPSEVNPLTGQLVANAPFVPIRGQMIKADIQTGLPLYPGDFALINAFNGNGADDIRDAVARVNPNTVCFSTVSLKPGVNQGPIRQGLNVRFDWYLGNMGGQGGGFTTNPEYQPARNVTKGLMPQGNGQTCIGANVNQAGQTVPFPRDDCFMTAPNGNQNCTFVNGVKKMGDGNWARNEYWTYNHGVGTPLPQNYATMSRYDTYRYEIASAAIDTVDEDSPPACYSGGGVITDPEKDRRVIIAAVINCVGEAANMQANRPVPTKTYAKLFLTEPMGNDTWSGDSVGGMTWNTTNQQDNYVEMIEAVPPNNDVLHVYPVLYR